jgi:hypothetical protein
MKEIGNRMTNHHVLLVAMAILYAHCLRPALAFTITPVFPAPTSCRCSAHHDVLAAHSRDRLSRLSMAETSATDDDDVTLQSLGETLRQRWNKLLHEAIIELEQSLKDREAPVAEQIVASPADRNLNPNEVTQASLLSTRIPGLNLNRTRIGPSTIPGAGRGLFAVRDIAKGEITTCYPGDSLLYEYEDEETDELVIWGTHVDTADIWDDDAIFEGIVDDDTGCLETSPLTDYILAVGDTPYSIMGLPVLDTDPAYYGHFANDGAGHFFANQEGGEGVGIEEGIANYVLESIDLSNAMHKALEDCHMVTVATRDITEGEEIFVTYGPDYWMEHISV